MAFLFLIVVVLFLFVLWLKSELADTRAEVTALKNDVSALRLYLTQLWQFLEDERRAAAGQQPAGPHADEPGVESPAQAETTGRTAEERLPSETPAEEPVQVPPQSVVPDTLAWPGDPYAAPSTPETVPAAEPVAAREPMHHPSPAAPSIPPRGIFGLDWEDLVGIRLFSGIAGVALVLAALFFLKYSVERGWLIPEVRAAIGLVTGIALIVICELKIARGYRITANAMHGAAIAILYATLYAIHAVWHLAPAAAVFALMLLVTSVAVLLSIRRDSVFIAVLGLLGGFATPALLSSGENRPLVLFSYLMLLNVGLSWVAYRKRWPLLTFGSLVLTVLYQWAWVEEFLDATQFPLAAAIFVVFGVIASYALWSDRAAAGDTAQRRFERVALTGVVLPLAFGLFSAAVPAYGARFHTLFGFLLLVCIGLAAIAMYRGHEWLHTTGGIAALGAFTLWCVISYTPAAWPAVLGWLAAFVILYLGVAARRAWFANYTAPALLFVLALLVAVEARTVNGWLHLGTTLALLAACGAVALLFRRPSLYVTAAAVSVVVQGVWALRHGDVAGGHVAVSAYAAFALLMIATSVLARRFARSGSLVSSAYVAFSAHVFLAAAATVPDIALPPWALFIVLALTGAAAGSAALYLERPAMMTTAVIATQAVLFSWSLGLDEIRWQVVALTATLAVAVWAIAWLRPGTWQRGYQNAALAGLLAGHFVAMAAAADGDSPVLAALLVTHLLLAAGTVTLAWLTQRDAVVVVSSVVTALGVSFAPTGDELSWRLLFATAIYSVYVVYALVVGAHRRSTFPSLAAVLAGVAYFFAARAAMVDAGWQSVIGILPIAQALAMLAILIRLVRTEPAGERNLTRLALVAATALAFITLAVPLQLDYEWVTIAWALEGAALIWLYGRIPHRGLIAWGAVLLAVCFVRLAMNPAILSYHPSSTAIVNWYLYTYLVTAGAFFFAARFLPPGVRKGRSLLAAGGTILLFVLLNVEIADFYAPRGAEEIEFGSTSLAQDLTYTMGWATFALALLVAGIVMSQRRARIAALVLLLVTIFKCFLHDLGNLEGLYRVGSLLGLALSLVAVGVLIQRFVMRRAAPEPQAA